MWVVFCIVFVILSSEITGAVFRNLLNSKIVCGQIKTKSTTTDLIEVFYDHILYYHPHTCREFFHLQ